MWSHDREGERNVRMFRSGWHHNYEAALVRKPFLRQVTADHRTVLSSEGLTLQNDSWIVKSSF
jgi:hypothetical protein